MKVVVERYSTIPPGGDRLLVKRDAITWEASENGITEAGARCLEYAWERIEDLWDEATGYLTGFRSFDHQIADLDEAEPVQLVYRGGHLLIMLNWRDFTRASVNALNVSMREWLVSQAYRPNAGTGSQFCATSISTS